MVIASCSATKSRLRFFATFIAAMNWPWFRKPAVASSNVNPIASSCGWNFASSFGLFPIFVETAFGGAGSVVVVPVDVVPRSPVDGEVVDVDAVLVGL